MRVGFDARWFNGSGVGSYVSGLLHALAVARREFEIIVYEDPHGRVPGLDNLPVTRIDVNSPRYSLSEQSEIRQRARQDRLDLFHSPFYCMPIALHCPVVVTIHDLIPFMFPIYPWPKQQMVKMGYRLAARRAHHLIANSYLTAHDIHRVLGVPEERITAVYLGAPSEVFHPAAVQDELARLNVRHGVSVPYFVVGSARNWRTKNLKLALAALRRTSQLGGIPFQTVIFGPRDGLDAAGPLEQWKALDIRYCGYVSDTELAMLFRNAHAFVTASLYEGFCLPMLEAMACGCAVVASQAGALPEIGAGGVQLFAPFDYEGMAAALAEILSVTEARARWRAAALQRAKDFSWSKAAAETISIYYRVTEKSAASTSESNERISIQRMEKTCEH